MCFNLSENMLFCKNLEGVSCKISTKNATITIDRDSKFVYNPVFDSYQKKKSLYPLYLLGYGDFVRCHGVWYFIFDLYFLFELFLFCFLL